MKKEVTKDNVYSVMDKIATKADIEKMKTEIIEHIWKVLERFLSKEEYLNIKKQHNKKYR